MKRMHILWQAAGFAFATLFGTILHFLYDWTGGSILVAPFSGINESTWEHMKLLYWPLLFFALFQSLFFRDSENFWCIKLWASLTGLVLIPLLFYTYNGAIGPSPDWVNITIFYIAAATAFGLEWLLLQKGFLICRRKRLALAVLCLIGGLFVIFTFVPPQLPLFQDPLSSSSACSCS